MRRLVLLALLGVAAAALWRRRLPRQRLREVLDPRPGERILEVGPGAGRYALPVAGWLAPGGTLEVLDGRRETLDRTLRRAAEHGVDGIVAALADARGMPYEDASMDGAYLVTVLGALPDQEAALRELHRVVRPGGRVVVGERFGDPRWVSPGALQRRAEAAGFRFRRGSGTPLGYFALLGRD